MSTEPCGSLPVIDLTISAHFCVHHMAFSANVITSRQTAADDVAIIHSQHRSFGPFDSWDDVLDFFMEHLDDPSAPSA